MLTKSADCHEEFEFGSNTQKLSRVSGKSILKLVERSVRPRDWSHWRFWLHWFHWEMIESVADKTICGIKTYLRSWIFGFWASIGLQRSTKLLGITWSQSQQTKLAHHWDGPKVGPKISVEKFGCIVYFLDNLFFRCRAGLVEVESELLRIIWKILKELLPPSLF